MGQMPPSTGRATDKKVSRAMAETSDEERNEEAEPGQPKTIVVGIGASAGGLEAFRRLLGALPKSTGMAYVLVQHLDPNHESILAELLSEVSANV